MRHFIVFLWVAVLILGGCGQQAPSTVFRSLAPKAAIIFRGTVLSVSRGPASAPDELARIRVSFRVEDGVRGATSGELLTISEWSSHAEQYRVGERLVLLLYAPSGELGLTSAVGGSAGHLRVDQVSQADLDAARMETLVRPDRSPRGEEAP